MAIIEDLSEEEAYLWAILQDECGLDQAEFFWVDEEKDDGCWRAWPFQWRWWRNTHPLQIDQCARSVGKSLSIKARAFAFPHVHPGSEMVITAPEGVHLDAITDVIETAFRDTRIGQEVLVGGRQAFRHRPFHANFKSGARIMGRIPQRDGKGVKGTHPIWLELDEACFPEETLILTKRGLVSIADVLPGDEVLTHRNRWKKVLNRFDRGEREIVRVRGQGLDTECTSNHHFWARKADFKDVKNKYGIKRLHDPEWIAAADLEATYYVTPTSIPVVPLPPRVIPKPVTGSGVAIDARTPEFLWTMGLYVAEGSMSSSISGEPNKVTWSIHVDEVDHVLKAIESVGLRPFAQRVQNTDNCKNIVVTSVELCRWLTAYGFGRGARNKTIPTWVLTLPRDLREAFLDGMVYGDGCWTSDKRYEPGRWRYSTASRSLAISLRLLALSLGYHVALHRYDSPKKPQFIRGKQIFSGDSYEVIGSRRGYLVFADDQVNGRIKKVQVKGSKRVYDLEIEDDHSFLADGVFVHNSDYPEPGWVELTETLKRGHAGAVWRAHGVTRGMRDRFFRNTQEDSGWTVHRYSAMWRPTWTDEERQEKIQQYGGRDDPDYRRNVLGEHGDEVSPIFVVHRLMQCVDDMKESEYNVDEYRHIEIKDSMLLQYGMSVLDPLNFGPNKYKTYWCGMDVGYVNHPSEILVFAEENLSAREREKFRKLHKGVPADGVSRLKLVVRITLSKIGVRDQYEVIKHVIEHFRPVAFGMDRTGNGLPLFQLLDTDENKLMVKTIKGYTFNEKILVDFDPGVEFDEWATIEDQVKEAGIKRNVVDYATDILRHLVDDKRLWLPLDRPLISEFQGQTWKIVKTTMDQYGRREFSAGKFHALDAARMFAIAWKNNMIEEMVKTDKTEPVLDIFVEF